MSGGHFDVVKEHISSVPYFTLYMAVVHSLTLSVSKRARSTKSSNVDKVFNWNGWCVFKMPLLEFIVDQLCFAETKFLLPWNATLLFSNETKSFWKCTWQLKLCCQKGCKHRLQILFIFDVVSVNNLGQKLT